MEEWKGRILHAWECQHPKLIFQIKEQTGLRLRETQAEVKSIRLHS